MDKESKTRDMGVEQYHLADLTDNAYTDMVGEIRQFIDDAEPALSEADYNATEELYGGLFDQAAWDFMWQVIKCSG